jgi:hypothetical protein
MPLLDEAATRREKPHFMLLTVQSKIPGYSFKLGLLFMLAIMMRFFERRISYATLQFILLCLLFNTG